MNNVTTGSPYVVVDVETTGIDASMHDLLEIAAVVIDPVTLEPLADIFEAVVKVDRRAAWNKATPFVREMHEKSGLWDRLETIQAVPLAGIDNALTNYLQFFGAPRSMPVMGNSVRLDMNFIDANLPYVSGYLDFHMRDVSTIAGLASDWYGLPWFEKQKTHRAKEDVLECIAELKYLREGIFMVPDRHQGTIRRDIGVAP